MKLLLINIILASCLLVFVESFYYPPSHAIVHDYFPYQPFIPDFRGHSSKEGFYQAIRGYPVVPEHVKYPEHHDEGTCSSTKHAVKYAVKFCTDVMKRLKEALQGCNKIETPIGPKCTFDTKCYTVSEYYDQTPNNMYAAYQRACPCPQKHFVPVPADLLIPEAIAAQLACFGIDSASQNEVVLTVAPNSNTCTTIGYLATAGTHNSAPGVDCTSTNMKKYLFVCEVPCNPSDDDGGNAPSIV